jgi:hypothetical protein
VVVEPFSGLASASPHVYVTVPAAPRTEHNKKRTPQNSAVQLRLCLGQVAEIIPRGWLVGWNITWLR